MASPVQQTGVRRWQGDDWSFAFTWQTGGTTPAPIPLTGFSPGAALWVGESQTPIDIAGPNGDAKTVDEPAGKFLVRVDKSITSRIATGLPPRSAPIVRLQVFVVDSRGERQTLGVLLVRVERP